MQQPAVNLTGTLSFRPTANDGGGAEGQGMKKRRQPETLANTEQETRTQTQRVCEHARPVFCTTTTDYERSRGPAHIATLAMPPRVGGSSNSPTAERVGSGQHQAFMDSNFIPCRRSPSIENMCDLGVTIETRFEIVPGGTRHN